MDLTPRFLARVEYVSHMNTFCNCNNQIDVSCSFLALVRHKAESAVARVAVFLVDGFMIFLCHIHLDEVQTLSFLNWNDTSRTSYNLWKKQDLLLGYVHVSHSAVWNKVSDGTAECRQHLP